MTNSKQTKISIIIRTKNEEKWITHCLDAVFNQKIDAKIEVILVDNQSSDHTVEIAKRFNISKFINIETFLPGKALNDGIRIADGDYLVCLSAHCVPEKENWLQTMINNFSSNSKLAGVYGRQLPLSYTDPIDKRDLLIVFGLDKRIQIKDCFFHNANSMIPRAVWEKFPFDEKVTNIEDRVWGKEVIEAGYNIIYEPGASVYHHHGLHHSNSIERSNKVVSILERIDYRNMNGIPKSMFPGKVNVAAVIPIIGDLKETTELKIFKKALKDLKKSNFVTSIYCLVDKKSFADSFGTKWLNRKNIKDRESLGLDKLMMHALEMIEEQKDFPECILYINHDYLNRPKGIFDELISDSFYKGFDVVFTALTDYGHYWYRNEKNEFEQTDPSLKFRTKREPLFKALYGLGCLTASWVLRSGRLVGGKVGIIKISNPEYANRNLKK